MMKSDIIGSSAPTGSGGLGGLVGTIIKIVKTIFGMCKKSSKEAGKTESNDSLENIERITQIFVDFNEQVHAKAVEVEKSVENEVRYYVEELFDIFTENAEKVAKYGIHTKRIERQIDRISSRVKGTIDNEISKKVSLDNLECREIVKMIPGTKKETAMGVFFTKSIKEALEICCAEIQSSLDEIYDDVETEVVGVVESIQKQIEQSQACFAAVDEDNFEETAKKQMTDSYFLTDTCDIVLDLLKED